jgi:hypothetical protein
MPEGVAVAVVTVVIDCVSLSSTPTFAEKELLQQSDAPGSRQHHVPSVLEDVSLQVWRTMEPLVSSVRMLD